MNNNVQTWRYVTRNVIVTVANAAEPYVKRFSAVGAEPRTRDGWEFIEVRAESSWQ